MAKADLTAERLRDLLNYDPETGVFVWKVRRGMALAGSIAGNKAQNGYIQIYVDNVSYKSHRLAWLYVHGRWPVHHIDHINGVRHDNRLSNLREATPRLNRINQVAMRSNNTSGFTGVYLKARPERSKKPWRTSMRINGKNRLIGDFATPEEAHEAYIAAKRKLDPVGTP